MELKEILQGLISPQVQGQQGMPQGQQMPPMPQMPQMQPQQPVMFDPYGQQQTGIRQALMGRMGNVRL